MHASNNVAFETVINGLSRALADGCRDLGIIGSLIMCFLPYQSEEDILKSLDDIQPYTMSIIGIELMNCDEKETTLPKFNRVYQRAKELGLHVVGYSGVMAAAAKVQLKNINPPSRKVGMMLADVHMGIIAPRVFATRGPSGTLTNTHIQVAHTLVDRLGRLLSASEYSWHCKLASDHYVVQSHPKSSFGKTAWEDPFKQLGKCISAADMELLRFVESLEEVLGIVEVDIQDRRSNSTL
eukprot:Em0631g3a